MLTGMAHCHFSIAGVYYQISKTFKMLTGMAHWHPV